MNRQIDVEVDPGGRLHVADWSKSRILIFNSAASLPNGANASYVLGQPDFVTASPNTGGLSDTSLAAPSGVSSTRPRRCYESATH